MDFESPNFLINFSKFEDQIIFFFQNKFLTILFLLNLSKLFFWNCISWRYQRKKIRFIKKKSFSNKIIKKKKMNEKKIDRDLLGITVKKEENWSSWFTQVITKTEMIEYYDVGGCYIVIPFFFSKKIKQHPK